MASAARAGDEPGGVEAELALQYRNAQQAGESQAPSR